MFSNVIFFLDPFFSFLSNLCGVISISWFSNMCIIPQPISKIWKKNVIGPVLTINKNCTYLLEKKEVMNFLKNPILKESCYTNKMSKYYLSFCSFDFFVFRALKFRVSQKKVRISLWKLFPKSPQGRRWVTENTPFYLFMNQDKSVWLIHCLTTGQSINHVGKCQLKC